MRTNRHTATAVPREELADFYARARKAQAVAIRNMVVRAVHKLTPRLSLRRLGEHWG